MTEALIIVLVVFGLFGMWLGGEMRRASRIAAHRDRAPKPARVSWLCRHGFHHWPWPPYDEGVCLRCGKPYLEP